MAPQKNQQHGAHPPSGNFWSVVDRRLDRFRRRRLRAQASPLSEQMGPITLDDAAVLQAPSDDEVIPAAQQRPLSLYPPFVYVDSGFEPQLVDGSDAPEPQVHAPERSGAD